MMHNKTKMIILFLIIFLVCVIFFVSTNFNKNKLFYKNFIKNNNDFQKIVCNDEKCFFNELQKSLEQENLAKTWFITQENLLPFYKNKAGIPDDWQKTKYFENKNNIDISSKDLENDYLNYWSDIKKFFEFDNNEKLKNSEITILREYVKHGINLIYYVKADVENKQEVIKFLSKIADNIISIQSTTGVFGTPDFRNYSLKNIQKNKNLDLALLKKIKQNQLELEKNNYCFEQKKCFEKINNNSWQIYHSDGGLQFDNGLTLAFLTMLYNETSNNNKNWNFLANRKKYLQSAIKSAKWIENQKCSQNFNYNSFSVYALANLYKATKNEKYLDLAIQKIKLGVFSGTIPQNYYNDWRDGRFMDNHNAKNTYHWIIVKASLELLAVMPIENDDYDFVKYYTNLVFQAGINEMKKFGIAKFSPANEISFYCIYFNCNNEIENFLTSIIYWNHKYQKDPFGLYYFYFFS